MKLSTFFLEPGKRWSVEEFPDLDSEQTLVMVFAAPEWMERPDALSDILAAYPRSKIIGCSTAGEIAGSRIYDSSLSVAVMQFERSRIKLAYADIEKAADSRDAGAWLGEQLAGRDLSSVFILSDGLQANGTELVKGLHSSLPHGITVAGGLAGDGNRFQRTWIIRDGKPVSGAIVAAGFYGNGLRITHGSHGGWEGFGPQRRITRSQGNVLYELDGRPALALYKEYLGERAPELPASGLLFPLSVQQDADARPVVRTMLGIDETQQAIIFAGDIPAGGLARLMRTNSRHLLNGATEAASQALRGMTNAGASMLAVAVSCVGRRLMLGERTEEEIEATLHRMPAGMQQVGFYSYGEIAPGAEGIGELHNQTMTLTIFSET